MMILKYFVTEKLIEEMENAKDVLKSWNANWFEYMNMDIMNYHVFRSVPTGDYCLIDSNGKIHIPADIVSKDNVSVSNNSPIRGVKIMNIKKIVEDNIENTDDEMELLKLNGLLEHLEDKERIQVSELEQYESTIRNLFEKSQGSIFSNKDKDHKTDLDESGNKKTHHK